MKLKALLCLLVVLAFGNNVGLTSTYDLGGRTITIASFTHEITPFAPRGEQTFLDPMGRLRAHIEAVEDMFNVNLKFVHHPSHEAIMDEIPPGVLTGETPADVYMIRRAEMVKLASDGYLWPLDGMLGDYNDKVPAIFQDQGHTMFNGKTYLMNTMKLPPTPIGILWNQDVFDEYGLPNLYELVEAGAWTWDALLDIAVQANRDTTGDGHIDLRGFGPVASTYGAGIMITELAMTNNTSWTKTVDGKVMVNFLEPEFLDTLQFLHDLVQAQNLPSPTYNSMGGMHNGTTAMATNAMRALGWPSYYSHNSPAMVGVVPLPMGPNATEYVYPEWSIWGYGIPITVKEPEGIVEMLKALYLLTSDYQDNDQWEQEYYNYTVATWAHDAESFYYLRKGMEDSRIAEEHWDVIDTPELRQAVIAAVSGVETPAVAMGRVADMVQARLDQAYNQ